MLYDKMSEILQVGAGHVAPKKQKRYFGTSYMSNSCGQMETSRMNRSAERRYKPFKRQSWDNAPGSNLVINRKSLNVESNRKVQEQIKDQNLRFLFRL